MGIKSTVNRIALGKIGLVGAAHTSVSPKMDRCGNSLSYFLCPISHIGGIIIWIGIQPKTINTRIFHPPNMVLGEEILNVRVIFVHICHTLVKPTIQHFFCRRQNHAGPLPPASLKVGFCIIGHWCTQLFMGISLIYLRSQRGYAPGP